uniref:Uncharacterized protein n=1 Tax=Tanacetum cinerariifolium TaxID=118510 RepID=A0A6L2J6B9_TANCI|nr:hypothetical protein [Tanacetum cinerariifolium]
MQQVQRKQIQIYLATSYKSNATSSVETMQVDRQGLLNATSIKTKDIDTYDSDCDDISNAKAVLMANISNYGSDVILEPQAFYDNIHKQALGYQNPCYLKRARWIKPTLYDGVAISNKHVAMHVLDNEDTLILEKVRRSKMVEKDKDTLILKRIVQARFGTLAPILLLNREIHLEYLKNTQEQADILHGIVEEADII